MTNPIQEQLDQNQNESVKSSGKTVDDAIAGALAKLNLSLEDVDVEIINQGSRGILGIGAEDAVVQLTPKIVASEEPAQAEIEDATSLDESSDNADDGALDEAFDAELQQRAVEILGNLLEKMGISANVNPRLGADLVAEGEVPPLTLDINGADLGLLIGRRGETLRALQFVTRQILNKDAGRWVPVVVDVESYLVRRKKTLEQLAERMADRAVFSGRRVVLEPMSAQERRIIHLQLRNHEQVYTRSTGEGEHRKVVILPK